MRKIWNLWKSGRNKGLNRKIQTKIRRPLIVKNWFAEEISGQ